MKGIRTYIIALCLAAVAFAGCTGARVIPKDKFAQIYADMILTDEWITHHPQYRTEADTMWVYEPIFNRYGYSTKDYWKSVDVYMGDPARYRKILVKAQHILEKQSAVLDREYELEQFKESFAVCHRPWMDFKKDTILVKPVPDSLFVQEDTL